MARPHSKVVEFSLANKGMLQVMMVLTAGVLVVAASPTASEHGIQWLLGTPAARTTSEKYLLASTMATSYGLNWPAPFGEIVGTKAAHCENTNYGRSVLVGDPSAEIEREAVWAKADVAKIMKLVQFENDEFKVNSDARSSSKPSHDTLDCVGYVSCSKPLHRYPRNTEYSMAWI